MGKHRPTKKASYTTSKLVKYLKRGGYVLPPGLLPYFLFSFSTVQCTTNFDLPLQEQTKPNAVPKDLKLSIGEKDGSRMPITVQLQSLRGGEPETVTVFYDPDTDTFLGSDGEPLPEELLASIQGIPIRQAYKHGDRVIIVEVYNELRADLRANKEQDDPNKGVGSNVPSNGNTKERTPERQQEARNTATSSMASSPMEPAPSANERMEDDNSVEVQTVDLEWDNKGNLQAPGLEDLKIKLCTTPKGNSRPTYSPLGKGQIRVVSQR